MKYSRFATAVAAATLVSAGLLVSASNAMSEPATSTPTVSQTTPATEPLPDSQPTTTPSASADPTTTITSAPSDVPTGGAETTPVVPSTDPPPAPASEPGEIVPDPLLQPGWTHVDVSPELSTFLADALHSTMQVAVDIPSNVGEAPIDAAEQKGTRTLESFFSGDILDRLRENLATSADSEASGDVNQTSGDVVVRSVDNAATDGTITRVRLAVTVSSTVVLSGESASEDASSAVDKFVTADVTTGSDGSKKISSLTYETPALPTE